MLVKIARYFSYPDIKRQTPNQSFKWKGITFTEEDVEECDFLVILDYPKNDFSVKVNKNNILHICLEPANEVSKYRQFANKQVSVVFNQYQNREKFVFSQPALPWHLDQDYDFFKNLKSSDLSKEDKIVWVTSNQRSSIQHNQRMDFLDSLVDLPFVELFGRGICPIDSKWEVMKSSKYAIAYENFKNDYNWTEKISDCFLSYTMPLYFGCNRIEEYFPKEAIIQIDPKDKHIKLFLKEIVASKRYENSLEAIIQARNLVLEKYQLFPFLESIIQSKLANEGVFQINNKEQFHFKGGDAYFDNVPNNVKFEKMMRKVKAKIKSKF
jgi:hypothetical protein